MNKKLTALLLSALVLPGLGQLYLGRKMVGGIIIVLVNLILLLALFVVLRGSFACDRFTDCRRCDQLFRRPT